MERQKGYPVLDGDSEDFEEVVEVNCKTESGFCGKCCYETEMPLSEEDVARIESLGYSRDEFSVIVDGVRRLRNVDGKCYFLKDDACSIYEYRPLGCRLYPAVLDGDRVVADRICPKWREVEISNSAKQALLNLVKKIYGDG